jgi:hypothetical protein
VGQQGLFGSNNGVRLALVDGQGADEAQDERDIFTAGWTDRNFGHATILWGDVEREIIAREDGALVVSAAIDLPWAVLEACPDGDALLFRKIEKCGTDAEFDIRASGFGLAARQGEAL